MIDLGAFVGIGPLDACRALGLRVRNGARVDRAIIFCPFHNEKQPSCSLMIGANGSLRAHCFSCHATSDLFGLVAACRSLDVRNDFRGVVAEAARLFGVEVAEVNAHPRSSTRPMQDRVEVIAARWLTGSPWPSEEGR